MASGLLHSSTIFRDYVVNERRDLNFELNQKQIAQVRVLGKLQGFMCVCAAIGCLKLL